MAYSNCRMKQYSSYLSFVQHMVALEMYVKIFMIKYYYATYCTSHQSKYLIHEMDSCSLHCLGCTNVEYKSIQCRPDL